MGIITNCCVHANNDDDKDQNNNNQAKVDLQKIISAKSRLGVKEESYNSRNVSIRKFNSINYKPYVGIKNYRNSNFINVNLQILSRLTYFKDFVNIMGRTSKTSNLIQNFIKIMNNISQGIPLDSFYSIFIDEVILNDNLKDSQPISFHLFFLENLCQTVYGTDLIFNEYKLGDNEISIKNVDVNKEKFLTEFSSNEIKMKFITGFLNLVVKHCKNIKCNYKTQEINSSILPFIEFKVEAQNDEIFSLQDSLNLIYFDKQHDGKCERCGKINSKFILINKILINHPKYLIIKIVNNNRIPLELTYIKNRQILFFSKNYEIFSIISKSITPGEDYKTNEFSCSIKIDYKWISFKDDLITVIDEDNLFENCYILYYQLR